MFKFIVRDSPRTWFLSIFFFEAYWAFGSFIRQKALQANPSQALCLFFFLNKKGKHVVGAKHVIHGRRQTKYIVSSKTNARQFSASTLKPQSYRGAAFKLFKLSDFFLKFIWGHFKVVLSIRIFIFFVCVPKNHHQHQQEKRKTRGRSEKSRRSDSRVERTSALRKLDYAGQIFGSSEKNDSVTSEQIASMLNFQETTRRLHLNPLLRLLHKGIFSTTLAKIYRKGSARFTCARYRVNLL